MSSLTDLYTFARDGAYRAEEEAGLVLRVLAALAEDRSTVDLEALEGRLAAIELEAPITGPAWCAKIREMAGADDPDSRALALTCLALVDRRDELRPDQWGHLVGCLGNVWWLLEVLEPFLMATVEPVALAVA